MTKYRKKPVVIEAVQLRPDTRMEMDRHVGIGRLRDGLPELTYVDEVGAPTSRCTPEIGLLIPTLEGLVLARENDWVIRGVKGELYPCKPDIFDLTYELVDTPVNGAVDDPYDCPICGGDP